MISLAKQVDLIGCFPKLLVRGIADMQLQLLGTSKSESLGGVKERR